MAVATASAVAVTQAPSEPITEPAVVVEEKTTVVVTKAQNRELLKKCSRLTALNYLQTVRLHYNHWLKYLKLTLNQPLLLLVTLTQQAQLNNMMISKENVLLQQLQYIEEQGIAADRIIATGEGEENPVASNDTAERSCSKPPC